MSLPPLVSSCSVTIAGHIIPSREYAYPQAAETDPLVSVLMPTYNHQDYIRRAIEGAVQQNTTFPIELIVAEDCSTDHTRAVIAECQTEYPHVIRMVAADENVGMRQNGLRGRHACRGKYVAPCDGDDYWHDPNKLQTQVDFLEANPDYGLVYTNADTVDMATGKRVEFAIPYRPELCDTNDPYVQQLTGVMTIWPLTVCIRTQLVHQLLRECPEVTDPSYAMGDTQRYLEVARRAKIKYVPVSTATRNLLVESTTRSQDTRKRARFAQSSERLILHYLEKYPLPPQQDRQVRDWVARRALRFAYLCRDKTRADEALGALQGSSVRVPLKYRLYHAGARNVVAHGLVRFVLKAISR